MADIKREAVSHPFQAAQGIVEQALLGHYPEQVDMSSLPSVSCLIRQANRVREQGRPKHPTSLDFDLDESHIPKEFLQADIRVEGARHLLCFTKTQRDLLVKTKAWYADGTFKSVREPFKQLFGIHGFIRSGDKIKQVPLFSCLMSRRQARDYAAVFNQLLLKLDVRPSVREVVMDFEKALWTALPEVLPEVKLRGCIFHWTQAVWRKAQELGLQRAFSEEPETKRFCRNIMALPLLPHERITTVFQNVRTKTTSSGLLQLCSYVEDTWIMGSLWPPSSWSVFMQPVRTNNDAEGDHNRLNTKAQLPNLSIYRLLPLLHEEAQFVGLQVQLLSYGKLIRYQRKEYRSIQAKILDAWDDFQQTKISTWELLERCSRIYCPEECRSQLGIEFNED